jgi:hypothetical protein
VQAPEHAAAEDLLDEPRVEVGELPELPLSFECAVRDERMHVGVDVGGVRAERPDRDDQAERAPPALEQAAESR